MDREKGIGAIVFAGKKLAQLEFLQLMDEAGLLGRHFLFRFRAMGRIGLFRGELAQRLEIGHRSLQFAQRIQERTHPRDLFDVDLRPLAVRPEIDRGHALFERAELAL